MWKTTVVTILALAVGALAGVGVAQARFMPNAKAAQAERETIQKENADLQHEAQLAQARITRLETENASLRYQLQEALDAGAEAPAEATGAEPEKLVIVKEAPVELEASAPPSRDDRGRREVRDAPWQDWRNEDGTPMDEAQREERRRQFAQQMRDRMNEFTNTEIAKSSDPEAQQRLATLNEQVQYMMDLRQQMRDAQTDEERDALRETMDQTRDTIRTLSEQQQDYMLRQLATQYGITAAAEQDQFLNSLRETQQSPYFMPPRGFGGFGGDGGGRGGPPRQ